MPAAGKVLVVRTRRSFSSPTGAVWPLLCDSRIEHSNGLLFRLGVPQPLECRLPDGGGRVGGTRECVSDRGVVRQRILVWRPERELVFRMETTNLAAARSIREIEDTFVLDPTSTGVRVTRTTRVFVAERVSWFGMLGLRIGLKQVHRYVFRSWQRAARRAKLTAVGPARDPAGPRNVSAAWDGGARDPPRP
jgi:hypothetical protein